MLGTCRYRHYIAYSWTSVSSTSSFRHHNLAKNDITENGIKQTIPLCIFQQYYRHTSRELKRIASVTLSPIYAHFSETITGLITIRAYRETERYI